MTKNYLYVNYDTKYDVLYVDDNITFDQVISNLVNEIARPEEDENVHMVVVTTLNKVIVKIYQINDGFVEEIAKAFFIKNVVDKVMEKFNL